MATTPIYPLDCEGHCCEVYQYISCTQKELKQIAKHLGISWAKFNKEYRIIHYQGGIGLSGRPCPFFDNPGCFIYTVRPRSCHRFVMFGQSCNALCRQVHNEMWAAQNP